MFIKSTGFKGNGNSLYFRINAVMEMMNFAIKLCDFGRLGGGESPNEFKWELIHGYMVLKQIKPVIKTI